MPTPPETTDSERLDYYENNVQYFRYSQGSPTMDNSHPPCWRVWTRDEGTTTRPTLREAIDAAMPKRQ